MAAPGCLQAGPGHRCTHREVSPEWHQGQGDRPLGLASAIEQHDPKRCRVGSKIREIITGSLEALLMVQVRLLHEMLNVAPWRFYPLSVQILSSEYNPMRAKCPPLPAHISVTVAPLEVSQAFPSLQLLSLAVSLLD